MGKLTTHVLDVAKGLPAEGLRLELFSLSEDNKTFIKISPRYYRKGEVNYLLGDSNEALKILKWKPKVNLSGLVKIMVKEEMNLLQNKRFY